MAQQGHKHTQPAAAALQVISSDVDEDRLYERGLVLVAQEAARVHRRLGNVIEPEELESVGRAALVGLVRSYDPERAPFEAYVRRRLYWAIIDGVRRHTHGRTAAARSRALFATAAVAESRAEQDQAAMGGGEAAPPSERAHKQRLRAILRDNVGAMAIALIASTADPANPGDPGETPEAAVMRLDTARELRQAVAGLDDERQRALIHRHYFEDEAFDRIADDLDISKGWASRLHNRAIGTLAKKLRQRDAGSNLEA